MLNRFSALLSILLFSAFAGGFAIAGHRLAPDVNDGSVVGKSDLVAKAPRQASVLAWQAPRKDDVNKRGYGPAGALAPQRGLNAQQAFMVEASAWSHADASVLPAAKPGWARAPPVRV